MKKVLVCDDDQDILDLVALVLEDQFEVSTEIDSTRLIQKAVKQQPDLILLDLWMPHLSGDKLAASLKKLPELQQVPVIIFSASKDGKEKALNAGANEFLAKPFDINELVDLVDRYSDRVAS